jgi:hypothetical protein
MSLIQKKDVDLLLGAGFSPEDLGLVEGGIQGVEVYESPDDYFAHEIIENAAEAGEIDLMDEITVPEDLNHLREHYDTSRKSLYADQEYAGNDDPCVDAPTELANQINFLKTVKLGKMTIWQRRNKNGECEWQVKNLKVEIPEDDTERFNKMNLEYKKELWISYARDEWKRAWEFTVGSLREFPIESRIEFKTKKGYPLNLFLIPADNVRKCGYMGFPPEARWITLVYFYKDSFR